MADGPRPPASSRSSSTGPGTSTTDGLRRWLTAPARPASDSDDHPLGGSGVAPGIPAGRKVSDMAGTQRRGGGAGGDRRGRDGDRRGGGQAQDKSNYIERVVAINRVAKVVKGGAGSASPRWSSSATVTAPWASATARPEVPAAIAKGVEESQEALLRGAADPGHHPAPGAGREGGWRGDAAARVARYRRDRQVARRVPCWSAPAYTTCWPSPSARRTRSTWCTPRWPRCRAWSSPRQMAKRRGKSVEHVTPAAILRARAAVAS